MALLTGSISVRNFILFWAKRFGKASCVFQLFGFPDLLEHLTNMHYIQNINAKVLLLTCWVGIVDCWKRKQKNKSEQLSTPSNCKSQSKCENKTNTSRKVIDAQIS